MCFFKNSSNIITILLSVSLFTDLLSPANNYILDILIFVEEYKIKRI